MSLRAKLLSLLGVTVIAGAAVAVLLFTLSAIKPARPEVVNGPLQIEPYESTITIPVAVPISKIQAEVNSVLPRNFNGEQGFNIGGNVHDERLTYTASRGDVSVTSSDGKLRFQMNINGRARASVEHCPGGRLLGCDTVTETATLAATVGADVSNISIDHNFNLTADLEPRINVTQAEIRILGDLIPISLRSETESAIRSAFPRLQSQFQQLLTNLDIQARIQEAWDGAEHIVPLRRNPPIWIALQPTTLSVGAVQIGEDEISASAGLGITAVTTIGEKPDVPKPSVPDTLTPISDFGFNVKLPILASLKEMQSQLKSCCLPFSLQLSGEENVSFNDVYLYENRGALIVGLDFNTGFLDAHGRLYLEGRPTLSEDKTVITFSSLTFDLRTERALLEGASELARPYIIEELERQLVIDVAHLFESAIEDSRDDLSEISLGQGVRAYLTVDEVALDDLLVGDNKVAAILGAAGKLSISVEDAD